MMAQKKQNSIDARINPIIFERTTKKSGRRKNWKENKNETIYGEYTNVRRTSTQLQWPVTLWRILAFFFLQSLAVVACHRWPVLSFAHLSHLCAHHYDLFNFFLSIFSSLFLCVSSSLAIHLQIGEFSCHIRTRMIRLVISFSFNKKNEYFWPFCDSIETNVSSNEYKEMKKCLAFSTRKKMRG